MLHVAHCAKKIRIPRTKTEPPNAHPARRVNTPPKAVRNANLATRDRLTMSPVPIVKIAMLVNTVNAKKTTGSTLLIQLCALTAPLAGPPRRAAPNAKLAKQVLLVISPVPIVKIAMLGNTVKAKKTTVSTLLIQVHVLIAQQGIHPVLVVPSAKLAGRGRTAMDAYRVPKVITATAVTLLRSLAEIAQPVTTVTTLVKVLVCRVFL
jgi:hypothetical protein